MQTVFDRLAGKRLLTGSAIARRIPEPAFSEENEQSLIRSLGRASLSGLARTANLLDTDSAAIRLALVGKNPLASFAHPLSGEGRVSGRDVLQTYGLAPKNVPGFHPIKHPVDAVFDVAGLGTEIGLDPKTYLTFGAAGLGRIGRAIKAAGLGDEVTRIATHATPGRSTLKPVGKATARMKVTPQQILDDAARRGVTDARERILRTGVKATELDAALDTPIGGLARFKLPGLPEHIIHGGKVGEAVAGVLDTAGTLLAGTRPARAIARTFSGPVANAKTAWGQQWMRYHFGRKEAGRAAGRERWADIARGIEEEAEKLGVLDKIRDPSVFRRIVEGFDKTLAGSKTLPEAQQMLAKELADLNQAGVNIREMHDVFANYWPREMSRGIHPGNMASRQGMTLSAEHQAKAHRKDFLMNMPGGTDVFQRLTKDPAITALIQARRPVEDIEKYLKGLPEFASIAAQQYPRYGKRGMMMKADPLTGIKRPVMGDRVNKLAQYIAESSDETRGLGLFGNHPFADALRYFQRSGEAQTSADTMGDMLADLSREKGVLQPGAVRKYQPGQGLKVGMYVTDLNRGNVGRIKQITAGGAEVTFRNRRTGQMNQAPVTLPLNQLQSTKMFRPAGTKRLPSIGKVVTKAGLVHGNETQGALLNIARKMGIANPTEQQLRELSQTIIPEQYADDITNVMKGAQAPSPLDEIGEQMAPVMNVWKSMQTNWPAFHGRNYPSGQVQNIMAGMLGPKDPARAWTLQRGGVIAGAAKFRSVPEQVASQGDQAATEWLRRQAFAHEVASPRQQEIQAMSWNPKTWLKPAQEKPLSYDDIQRQFPGARPEAGKTIAKGAIPLHSAGNVALGEAVEGNIRLSAFVNQMRKGVAPAEAAAKIRAAQVAYQGRFYTPTERLLANAAVPFYKFARQQAAYVPSQLAQKPGGAMAQTIRAINYGRDADVTTPDYVAETASIPLGPGSSGQDRYMTGMGFMFEDPLQFFDDPKTALLEGLSRTSPLIKTPLEYASGKTFFQRGPRGGRDIEDLDPTYGRIIANAKDWATGSQTKRVRPLGGQTAELLAGNLIGRPGTTLRMLLDPRKSVINKAMQATTGIRVADVSPAAQDAIVREQLQAAMKDMGAREFSKTYFPPEMAETLPPARQSLILQMKALNDLLAERTKKRKQATER